MSQLILYGTLGCHLCELAKQELMLYLADTTLTLQEVDIADNDDLLKRYGIRIPVLKLRDTEHELGWPFDVQDISYFIGRFT